MTPLLLSFAATATVSVLAGCGVSSPNCSTVTVLGAGPSSAVISSAAKSPANRQKFGAYEGQRLAPTSASTCAVPAFEVVVPVLWTTPDTVHIAISSAHDSTNGLATCLGPTGGPVPLTATDGAGANALTTTVSLTCQ